MDPADQAPPREPDRDLRRSGAPAPDLAPEPDNPEQDDEPAQAQTLSDEIMRGSDLGLSETVKVSSGEVSDDVPDLVDHMRQMASSGVIDMGAYAGERNDDEEEDRYGPAAEED